MWSIAKSTTTCHSVWKIATPRLPVKWERGLQFAVLNRRYFGTEMTTNIVSLDFFERWFKTSYTHIQWSCVWNIDGEIIWLHLATSQIFGPLQSIYRHCARWYIDLTLSLATYQLNWIREKLLSLFIVFLFYLYTIIMNIRQTKTLGIHFVWICKAVI